MLLSDISDHSVQLSDHHCHGMSNESESDNANVIPISTTKETITTNTEAIPPTTEEDNVVSYPFVIFYSAANCII